MTEAESRLAELIWEVAPVGSGELVQLCTERLGWKKSTTYTMLRKLCALGVARNENATVTAAVSTRKASRSRYFRSMTENPFVSFFAAVFSNFSTVQMPEPSGSYFAFYILMESARRVNAKKRSSRRSKGRISL